MHPYIKQIGLLLCVLFGFMSFGQRTISGKIRDENNLTPLALAHIQSSIESLSTDDQGNFEIKRQAQDTLLISFIGYETTRVPLAENQEFVQINLSPSMQALDYVVVSAGVTKDKVIDKIASIGVVTPEIMNRDASLNIANALNTIPGVYMHTSNYNTNRITIRGMGARSPYATNRIKAYYEDIPLTDGNGNSAIEDLDQSLIGRIEITKGPNSSSYGAGIGGAVLMSAPRPDWNKTNVSSLINVGSFGTYRSVSQINHATNNLQVRAVYADMQTDGFRENSQYQKQQAGLIGKYFFKNDSYISLIGIYTDLHAQIPSSLTLDDFKGNPKAAAATWKLARGYEDYQRGFYGLSYHYQPAAKWQISHAINAQQKTAYEPAPRPVNITTEDGMGWSTRHTATFTTQLWKVAAGFEWFMDDFDYGKYQNDYTDDSNGSIRGALLSRLTEKRSYSNTFAEANFNPTKKLKLTAGLNLNFTKYSLDDEYNGDNESRSGNYDYKAVLSPRFGTVYHLSENIHLFGNISHGFSNPSLEETLYPDGLINTAIKPEKCWNYELGARTHWQHFNLSANAYYMNIQNLLVTRRTIQDQYIGVNAGKNQHLGLEIAGNYSLNWDKNQLNIYSNANFTNYTFVDFTDDESTFDDNQVPGVPKYSGTSGIDFRHYSGIYFHGFVQWSGKIPVTDSNEVWSERYAITRIKLGYQHQFGRFHLNAFTGIDNLTNESYASMVLINANFNKRYFYPGQPRSFYGGLAVNYTIRNKGKH